MPSVFAGWSVRGVGAGNLGFNPVPELEVVKLRNKIQSGAPLTGAKGVQQDLSPGHLGPRARLPRPVRHV
jgi:hypothetical protein